MALLVDPGFPSTHTIVRRVRAAAPALGLDVRVLEADDLSSLRAALGTLGGMAADALLVGGSALHVVRARELIEDALRAGVPVVHYWPGTAEMGALISYQADTAYNSRRAAYYVDRILKGARTGELPIEQPMHYALVVNRATAKALGLTLPAAIVLRADKLID